MLELLTLGGLLTGIAAWGFWSVVIVVLAVFIALTEGEHWGWASTLFVGVFASLWTLGVFNIWKYAVQHPASLAYWFCSYIGIGLVWGAIKWYFYCRKQRRLYEEAKADFLEANDATEMTALLRVAWTEKLNHQTGYERYHLISIKPPEANKNKEKIMNWMYLWPFSILGTFLSDFVREVWEWLYERMGKIYDNIAKMVWKGVEEDLASELDIQKAREAAVSSPTPKSVAAAINRTAGRY